MRNPNCILRVKHELKKPRGKPGCRGLKNIKHVLKEWDVRMGLDWIIWLSLISLMGPCEHGNIHSCSLNRPKIC